MRWRGRRQSAHVEDRRGRRGAVPKLAGGGVGILLLVGVGLLLGVDPRALIQVVQTQQPSAPAAPAPGRAELEDEQAQFVAVVLARLSQTEANQLSVRQELQADCFSGIWAHYADRTRNLLERGDIDEGLNAASAIGDDRLQKQSRGYVTPESFTHGSSDQRVWWFKHGYETGDVNECDTFGASRL